MLPSDTGLAPQGSPVHRAAKLAVIILSVLIILAVIALVVGIVKKAGKAPVPVAAAGAFQLPLGAHVREMATQPGRLILRLETAGGEEVVIIDTQDGHLVSRIASPVPNQTSNQVPGP